MGGSKGFTLCTCPRRLQVWDIAVLLLRHNHLFLLTDIGYFCP